MYPMWKVIRGHVLMCIACIELDISQEEHGLVHGFIAAVVR